MKRLWGLLLSLIGWYWDSKNTIELIMKEGADKWVLRQRVDGMVVTKAKASMTIDAGADYDVRLSFDGNAFSVSIDGALLISMPKAPGSYPNGTVGFQVKDTTGHFGSMEVN